MSYKQKSPIPVIEGGTNASAFANDFGVAYYDAVRLNNINPGTSGHVLTSNGALLAPSFQANSASGFTWNNTTGATQAMTVDNGYVSNDGVTLVTFTLPATAAIGKVVGVQGSGSGLFTIAQNSGQTIHFNGGDSTTGVTGTVSSSGRYDAITLICIVADTDWAVNQSVGNFNVV